MLKVPLRCHGFSDQSDGAPLVGRRMIGSVATAASLASIWQPDLTHLVPVTSDAELAFVLALQSSGVTNLTAVVPETEHGWQLQFQRFAIADPAALKHGDVVALDPSRRFAEILLRASDQHHTVFVTNRCNSHCVMCSQPPTQDDDSWRVEEAQELLRHMSWSPATIGFTGGEPLLLGDRLRPLLMAYAQKHAEMRIEVLTNGRQAADDRFASELFTALPPRFCWMVPLYGHAPFLHDYVVQHEGAFDETLCGLLNLQRHAQPIQLRVVLIRPVLEILPALADFIARNLPFVREVALMGCEPIGFALANRRDCEVDLMDWQRELRAAIRRLQRGAVPVILMNTPLCGLDRDLWPHAHRSISDWKNAYTPSCDQCTVKDACCGLFEWHARGWKPTTIRPVTTPSARQHEAAS